MPRVREIRFVRGRASSYSSVSGKAASLSASRARVKAYGLQRVTMRTLCFAQAQVKRKALAIKRPASGVDATSRLCRRASGLRRPAPGGRKTMARRGARSPCAKELAKEAAPPEGQGVCVNDACLSYARSTQHVECRAFFLLVVVAEPEEQMRAVYVHSPLEPGPD